MGASFGGIDRLVSDEKSEKDQMCFLFRSFYCRISFFGWFRCW